MVARPARPSEASPMKVISPQTLALLLHDRLADGGDPSRAVTLSRFLDSHLSYAVVRAALGLAGKGEYDVAVLGLLADRTLLQVDPAVEAGARRELESAEPGLGFATALSDRLLRLRPDRADASMPDGVGATGSRTPNPEEEPPALDVEVLAVEEEEPERQAARPAARRSPASEPAEGPARATETPQRTEPPLPEEDSEPPELPAEEPSEPSVVVETISALDAPQVSHVAEAAEPQLEAPEGELAPDPVGTVCWTCTAALPDREGVRFCPHCGSDQEGARCTACGDRLEPGWAFCPRCGRGLQA